MRRLSRRLLRQARISVTKPASGRNLGEEMRRSEDKEEKGAASVLSFLLAGKTFDV
jgi:hypothetical protein